MMPSETKGYAVLQSLGTAVEMEQSVGDELYRTEPSVIAFHLPQFHEIPENNEWWGKGFTEWTNVQRAKPLFPGHRQPRSPLNNNYYDLSDHAQLIKQANMAREYGVGGFCFYHYWFNGQRLLERPVEAMLEERTPDFPYMLAWANHAWTRAWNEGSTREILMPMEYGTQVDWDRHYACLARFFSDDRYIRIGGKPVFLLFHPEAVPVLQPMLDRWQSLATTDGFDGIYFIRMLSVYSDPKWDSPLFSAAAEFEPGFAMLNTIPKRFRVQRLLKRLGAKAARNVLPSVPKVFLQTFSYRLFVDNIIERKPPLRAGRTMCPGVFVDWDNTPRRRANGDTKLLNRGATPLLDS
jgi:hypothetical protein